MADRTVRDVIDQAIQENRFGERLLYVFACGMFGVGIALIIHGMIVGSTTQTVVGAIGTSTFIPAVHVAQKLRQQNMSVRLLEAALMRADTAKDAAQAIRAAFTELFTKNGGAGKK